jgi:hypothetical protein
MIGFADGTPDQKMCTRSTQGGRLEPRDRPGTHGYVGAAAAVVLCAARHPFGAAVGGEQRARVLGCRPVELGDLHRVVGSDL